MSAMLSAVGRRGARAHEYVPLAELEGARLRVAISPLPTVFILTRDALRDGLRRTPTTWRAAVRSRLGARDAEALAPLTDPRTTGWPGALTGIEATRETLHDALARVAATPGAVLLDAVENDPDVTPTPAWDALRRDPERWLRGYVDALLRSWSGLEPLWQRSLALLEREAEKAGAALARGVPVAQIVAGLDPRASLAGDALRLHRAPAPRRLGVGERGLLIAPTIADGGLLSSPGDRLEKLAYPMANVWRAFDDRAPSVASMQALLGEQRAAILRGLERPRTAGGLAEALGVVPSGISFHLVALERAGLVVRERRGRYVIVKRTERGTALVDLYESA